MPDAAHSIYPRRLVIAAVAAVLSMALLAALAWLATRRVSPSSSDHYELLYYAVPFFGPFVFAITGKSRPEWLWGLKFALVTGIPGAVFITFIFSFELSGAWFVLVPLGTLLAWFVFGMAGAGLAVAVARPLVAPYPAPRHKLRPWQVGFAVVIAELIDVLVVALVS